jgi:hypothetical protein
LSTTVLPGVVGVSAKPSDATLEACGDDQECSLIAGFMTIESTGDTGVMIISCAVLEVLKDDSVMTTVATEIDGLEAVRYEGSPFSCNENNNGNGGDNQDNQDDTDTLVRNNDDNNNSSKRDHASNVNLTLGTSVAVTAASVVLFIAILTYARRRHVLAEEQKEESWNLEHGESMLTQQNSPTSMISQT